MEQNLAQNKFIECSKENMYQYSLMCKDYLSIHCANLSTMNQSLKQIKSIRNINLKHLRWLTLKNKLDIKEYDYRFIEASPLALAKSLATHNKTKNWIYEDENEDLLLRNMLSISCTSEYYSKHMCSSQGLQMAYL